MTNEGRTYGSSTWANTITHELCSGPYMEGRFPDAPFVNLDIGGVQYNTRDMVLVARTEIESPRGIVDETLFSSESLGFLLVREGYVLDQAIPLTAEQAGRYRRIRGI